MYNNDITSRKSYSKLLTNTFVQYSYSEDFPPFFLSTLKLLFSLQTRNNKMITRNDITHKNYTHSNGGWFFSLIRLLLSIILLAYRTPFVNTFFFLFDQNKTKNDTHTQYSSTKLHQQIVYAFFFSYIFPKQFFSIDLDIKNISILFSSIGIFSWFFFLF